MELIEEIKKSITLEIRQDSKESLEAVVTKEGLERLQSILSKHLGPAIKEAGKKAEIPKHLQSLVDSFRGLRIEQSFYCRQEGTQLIHAALWPWESNPDRTTLKLGITKL